MVACVIANDIESLWNPVITIPHYLLIDLEGNIENWVEASIFLVTEFSIVATFHDYAYPKDVDNHRTTSRYCHGLKLEALEHRTNNTPTMLQQKCQQWIADKPSRTVLSADASPNSDVAIFTQTWGITYHNIELKPWVDRIKEKSHQVAVTAKLHSKRIADNCCHYRTMHHKNISAYTKSRKPLSPSKIAKMNSFTHCSYLDTLELFLFAESTNAWPTT